MSKCNCIEDLTARIKDRAVEKEHFKKPVISARMKGVAWMFDGSSQLTCKVEFELEGQKKKPTLSIVHSYCPFCGIKLGE